MHLDQLAYQGQPDSQPAVGPLERLVCLREHVENGVQLVFRDADAGVPHARDGLALVLFDRHRDSPTRFGELGGVVEQVAEDLHQSLRICVQPLRIVIYADAN